MDITKCSNEDCKQKEECYRYTANEGMLQSYFSEDVRDGDNCEYFWKTNK